MFRCVSAGFSKLHTTCLQSPCLFWVTLALVFLLLDFIMAHLAVLHCQREQEETSTLLVASDPHFNEVCPFSSTWMRHLMHAAVYNWNPDAIVVTGDILNNVGGESSALNVSNWWYDALAQQVKQSLCCESAKCHFAPGNHDLELGKYHHRYVKHFGWPHSHHRAGAASLYLFNSMDPNGTLAVPSAKGPVDFLFAHHPVRPHYMEFQPSTQLLATVQPRLLVDGHDHVFGQEHSIEFRGWKMNEVTVPSLSFYRSRRDGGRTGFVLLHKLKDGAIRVQLCEPWERAVLLSLRTVALVVLVCLHCYHARESIAKSLGLWLLLLLGIAYILLAFFGWTTLIWTCAAACALLLYYHCKLPSSAYQELQTHDTHKSPVSTKPVYAQIEFEL